MPTASRDDALADFVRLRGEALIRYAYLLTGDTAAAKDLVQDAVVKVFVRTRSGFEPTTLEAYVRRTIANLNVDGHRRRRTVNGVQHLVATPDAMEGPEDAVTAASALQQALAALSRQERTVVVLRFFEDLTVPRIADAMGISEGSVKRYLSNATGKLQHRLGPVRSPRDQDDVAILTLSTDRPGRS